jgi:hypothetical protein
MGEFRTAHHQVTLLLHNTKAYYWLMRYQNSAGAWTEYSHEISLSTLACTSESVLVDPSDMVNNTGHFEVSASSSWATTMDNDDGDMRYISRRCDGSSKTFSVSMDDPVVLEGGTLPVSPSMYQHAI